MEEAPVKFELVDINDILKTLPHRFPMLLIDRVIKIRTDYSGIGIKNVTFNEPQFQGHFPGMPIFPGVMIIEAMAQTSGILVGLSMGLVDKNATVFFMGVDGVKFRRKVVPGDVMELHVKALRGGGRVWKFEGRAMVGTDLCCEATFMAMFDVPKA
jgi:3-hydroxyacyl-[acyl-carrier-protein] dehydratase